MSHNTTTYIANKLIYLSLSNHETNQLYICSLDACMRRVLQSRWLAHRDVRLFHLFLMIICVALLLDITFGRNKWIVSQYIVFIHKLTRRVINPRLLLSSKASFHIRPVKRLDPDPLKSKGKYENLICCPILSNNPQMVTCPTIIINKIIIFKKKIKIIKN
jgi:hypothetical protein